MRKTLLSFEERTYAELDFIVGETQAANRSEAVAGAVDAYAKYVIGAPGPLGTESSIRTPIRVDYEKMRLRANRMLDVIEQFNDETVSLVVMLRLEALYAKIVGDEEDESPSYTDEYSGSGRG